MSSAPDIISQAMQEAVIDGTTSEPVALIALLSGIADPFAALSDHDRGNELFDAIYRDLPFIQLARHRNKPLDPAEHQRLVELLRWIIAELRGWRAANDPLGRKLVAVFVAAQTCDWDSGLWDNIPTDIGNNAELTNRLKILIASFAVMFSSRDPARTPLWEREAVETLKSAEAANDWAAIGSAWPPFSNALMPSVIQMQAGRCLYRCGVSYLADALAKLNQTAVGMMIATVLSTTQKLNLAVTSDNGYVQFCCLWQTLSDHRAPKLVLTTAQEQLMTQLLLKVATDEPKWAAWMKAFNSYPLRYPALQKSLGMALADAPDTVIAPHVDSIVLYPRQNPGDAGRAAVAVCLGAFRSKASPARRNGLWTIAHKRWSDWEFNREDKNQHLLSVSWCELDYALVGYACECLDSGGRTLAMKPLVDRLQSLEEQWFASITDIVTAWNRLLSLYQPYAYAEYMVVPMSGDWLSSNKQCLPFDPAANTYTMAKFHLG